MPMLRKEYVRQYRQGAQQGQENTVLLGLPMYDAPNAVEKLKQPRKHPTPEKVEAIKDALKHFEVI